MTIRFGKTILTSAALLSSGTTLAAIPDWRVSESSGPVMVSRSGFQTAAARGGAVKAGDIVSTGKSGRAVLVRGDEYLVVSPGTRIAIATPRPGGMTQVIQSFGNTLFKIKKMVTPHFAVETPYLAAVVKGTTFSVTVTDKGASVQVTEGRVEVATPDGGASYLVTPGEIGLVSRDAPYRLTVQGKETITVDSPNKATSDKAAVPAADPVRVTASALDGGIGETVGEGPVQLERLSGGLIGGDTSLAAAATAQRSIAVATLARRLPPQPMPPVPATPAGGDSGNDGDSGGGSNGNSGDGNGNGGGNGNGNDGNGNGNGGGNGNGNDGNGNGNGGGNGNGNNGNGNGNGGGNGNGNNGNGNNGNGNGNGGGNGNGNNGNGNGNGGGNGNGNNGNGNGNGGGNGNNGNGNGNGGGNGNGNNGNGNGNGGGNGNGNNGNGNGNGGGNGNGNNGNGNGNGNGGGRGRP